MFIVKIFGLFLATCLVTIFVMLTAVVPQIGPEFSDKDITIRIIIGTLIPWFGLAGTLGYIFVESLLTIRTLFVLIPICTGSFLSMYHSDPNWCMFGLLASSLILSYEVIRSYEEEFC